jgi:type IV secretory pathway VirB2 component (pilin)
MDPNLAPPLSNPVAAALQWLDGVFLGTLASLIAVIAIGSIGFLLLTGRVDVRRAAQVVIGCFIIFGASTIAEGILHAIAGSGSVPQVQNFRTVPPIASVPAGPPRSSSPYDPYAGAALPSRP